MTSRRSMVLTSPACSTYSLRPYASGFLRSSIHADAVHNPLMPRLGSPTAARVMFAKCANSPSAFALRTSSTNVTYALSRCLRVVSPRLIHAWSVRAATPADSAAVFKGAPFRMREMIRSVVSGVSFDPCPDPFFLPSGFMRPHF